MTVFQCLTRELILFWCQTNILDNSQSRFEKKLTSSYSGYDACGVPVSNHANLVPRSILYVSELQFSVWHYNLRDVKDICALINSQQDRVIMSPYPLFYFNYYFLFSVIYIYTFILFECFCNTVNRFKHENRSCNGVPVGCVEIPA